jgi:hypothetical protein
MTYGHAERNLAFIRQLEAEARQLRCHYGPDAASLAAQPNGVWTWAAADQGGEYSRREVQQQSTATGTAGDAAHAFERGFSLADGWDLRHTDPGP